MSAVLTVAMLQDDKPTPYVPAASEAYLQYGNIPILWPVLHI